ncbi:hypothetical protein M406DRAFT_331384 [Cryphonectria parasitica EP155]|uniref:Alpha-ketoglutarate-dependent dioxygenase AlkB-like domain-containing protein n=1 Tax=Cryphonectria parasitica (strain ATCC 38755 / EP155) TaxID=660469 RepID=A0A9P4Y2P6_CRYP1|nr:uncharacterized protein M406DRAFT_331384 [Cryphonectria parasitica EP155]KAF3765075.1 hypothetical protein M406DRAFT_331384 [Cryphonectria parasitica EP155]
MADNAALDPPIQYEDAILRRDMQKTWQSAVPPPYFAEHRAHLINATTWFHTIQAGYYATVRGDPRNIGPNGEEDSGFCLGLLLGKYFVPGAYLDAEVIITSINTPDSAPATTRRRLKEVTRNMEERRPIGVVIQQGATSSESHGYPLFPCTMTKNQDSWPLAWFVPTFIWPEPADKGKKIWMVRLEKCDIEHQSWWADPAHGQPPVITSRDYTTKAETYKCETCDKSSPKIFEQAFVCLNPDCEEWWTSEGDPIQQDALQLNWTYSASFLKERWDRLSVNIQGLEPCYPLLYPTATAFRRANYDDLMVDLQRQPIDQDKIVALCHGLMRGFACPQCGMLNTRVRWHEWHCRNDQCTFTIRASPPALTPEFLDGCTKIEKAKRKWAGFDYTRLPGYQQGPSLQDFTVHQYTLAPGCSISILRAKPTAMAVANEYFTRMLALANLGRLNLERRMLNTPAGMVHTNHFNSNFGARYIFGVLLGTTRFEHGPPEVKAAVDKMNDWLGPYFLEGTGDFNQLYFACYLADMAMSMHDDGESGLGPNVATWTLGGRGTFSVAIKPVWDYGRKLTARSHQEKAGDTWIDEDPLIQGCTEYAYRKEIWERREAGEIDHQEWKRLFRARMEQKRGAHRILLKFPVDHGDIVLMHGEHTQRYLDHAATVDKTMPMRLALTFRTVERAMATEDKIAEQDRKIETNKSYKRDREEDSPEQPAKKRRRAGKT